MVSIVDMENRNFRTFGWVQDPSDFDALFNVVSIFDKSSKKHKELKSKTLKLLVGKRDGQDRLIEALNTDPLKIKYSDLVGTSFIPRSEARCNGIVQAVVKGQRRPFIADWPADNFVRWAHALGFIKYNYYDDTFEITKLGLEFTDVKNVHKKNDIIQRSILGYSPAVRILTLLEDGEIKTKFELGEKLGFIGEDGFTSLPQHILIMTLAKTEDINEKNKLRTDTEGSSDKYARMIASWLSKLGLVEKITKTVTVKIGKKEYKEDIGQSYIITSKGLKALNMIKGKSKFKKIPKTVCYEMFSTKGKDRDYIRTRRSFVLKVLIDSTKKLTLKEIQKKLINYDVSESETTIKDDIIGFVNIGLNIEKIKDKYILNDNINDFIIPRIKEVQKSDILTKKENLREKLSSLSHDYLSLIDLSYDSKQNKLFEMKVMGLLIDECNYQGLHLGGSRKPDGIAYTKEYGIIIDTKAYSEGYSLPISQADEMMRYIKENNDRDIKVNNNKWWENFDEDIKQFYFAFISSEFKGNITEKLERIYMSTNVKGTAIAIYSLLIMANDIKAKNSNLNDIQNIFLNNEYECL